MPRQYTREHLVLLPFHELVTLVLSWQNCHKSLTPNLINGRSPLAEVKLREGTGGTDLAGAGAQSGTLKRAGGGLEAGGEVVNGMQQSGASYQMQTKQEEVATGSQHDLMESESMENLAGVAVRCDLCAHAF